MDKMELPYFEYQDEFYMKKGKKYKVITTDQKGITSEKIVEVIERITLKDFYKKHTKDSIQSWIRLEKEEEKKEETFKKLKPKTREAIINTKIDEFNRLRRLNKKKE